MWLKLSLAIRNTFRHRRRTLLNLFMIAGGVSLLLTFEGLVRRLVIGLRETTIRTQTGHLQIAKHSYWAKNSKRPKDTLILQYDRLLSEIKKNPHVRYASGRLNFFGLLARGDRNISASGVSFDPLEEKSRNKSFHFLAGKALLPKKPYQVAVGSGLAKKLGCRVGDSVVVMTQTYDGVINALDMEVGGIFRTAISEFDDNTFLVSLMAAQKLLDTRGVETIVVGLDHTSSTIPIRKELNQSLSTRPELGIQPWYQLAKLYTQVAGFTRIQNRMFQFIILALVMLSILNTIGMSVYERTSEIGTLRALGESRLSIVLQFLLEGTILGLIGGFIGVAFGFAIAGVVNWGDVKIIMPGATHPFKMQVLLTWISIRGALGFSVLIAMCAAVIPAWRASRMKITDALR